MNAWIRSQNGKLFSGIIDFDHITRDQHRADHLRPAYDSGDHIHPSLAGYSAMGNAVLLTLFH